MKQISFQMPTGTELQSLIDFCKVMASAPFYSKLGPGGVLAIFMTAKEYNLPFMACMNGGVYTYDGKVSFSAIMIHAMILQAGHRADVLVLDETRCKILFTRGDRKEPQYKGFTYEYKIEDAQRADYLKKDNWRKSPKDMLYSRCLTGGGRKHIPEVLVGVNVVGELIGTDSDDIEPLVPDVQLSEQNSSELPPAAEPPKALPDLRKLDGYDEFCKTHDLFNPESLKAKYIKETCLKTNMEEVKVINYAIKRPDFFIDKFNDWKDKNTSHEKNLET